jgi:non-homologous end joining protein Ku
MWPGMAASAMMPSYGSQDWIGGALGQNQYRTLADQFSAFERDQRFQQMFQAAGRATASQAAHLPNSMLGAWMAQGGQQFTGQHANNVESAIAYGMPFIMSMAQTSQGRAALDMFTNGAAIGNANVSLDFHHRRLLDPVTGNRNLSYESSMAMSNAGFRSVFGDPSSPIVGGLYGAGSAEFAPLLNFMSKHSQINTRLEADLLGDADFIRGARTATGSTRQRYRDMMKDYGMSDDIVDEYMGGGASYDDQEFQDLIRRGSGTRIFEKAKGLKSLTNAIRELAGPEIVTNVNEALAALESLAGGQLSQFSEGRLASIIRNTTNTLKPLGLGWEEASAYLAYSNQRAGQMGYQGAMGVSNMQYMANARAGLTLSGGMAAASYGLFNENQLTQMMGDQRLAYGKSQHASLQAAMVYYGQTGGEFTQGAAGDKLRDIMQRLQATGSGGEAWDKASMEERMAMMAAGFKDPNAMGAILQYAGNDSLVEAIQGNNTALLDNGAVAIRYEHEDASRNVWAREAANIAGFGGDLADKMTSAFYDMTNEEAKDPARAAEALARRLLGGMTESEKNKYGADDETRIRKLSQLTGGYVNSVMQNTGTVNLGNYLNQYGNKAMDARASNASYSHVQTLLDNATQDMMSDGLTDFVTNIMTSAKEQLGKTGSVNVRELLDSGLSTLGPGDKKNRAKLTDTLGAIADEQDKMTRRMTELINGGEGDSVEAKTIKSQLKMLDKYMTELQDVLEKKISGAEETADEKKTAGNQSATFNNLVMVMPNNMEVRVGDVTAKPQGVGAVS